MKKFIACLALLSIIVLFAGSVGGCACFGKRTDNRPVQVMVPPAQPPVVAMANTIDVIPPVVPANSEPMRLVTKYKKVRDVREPQELTYVESMSGRTYIGPKVPTINLEPEYAWGRVEIAARNPEAPADESRSIWVLAWTPITSSDQQQPILRQ